MEGEFGWPRPSPPGCLWAHIGRERNEAVWVALIGGLFGTVMVAGALGQLGFPLIFVGDAGFGLLMVSLWQRYANLGGGPGPGAPGYGMLTCRGPSPT